MSIKDSDRWDFQTSTTGAARSDLPGWTPRRRCLPDCARLPVAGLDASLSAASRAEPDRVHDDRAASRTTSRDTGVTPNHDRAPRATLPSDRAIHADLRRMGRAHLSPPPPGERLVPYDADDRRGALRAPGARRPRAAWRRESTGSADSLPLWPARDRRSPVDARLHWARKAPRESLAWPDGAF